MNWDIVLQYVLPSALGVVAGLFSPWANWGIEKRKQRLQRRRELIAGWRLELIPMVASSQDSPEIWAGPKQAKVLSTPFHASLRPHLSEAAVKRIEDNGTCFKQGQRTTTRKSLGLSISPHAENFRS